MFSLINGVKSLVKAVVIPLLALKNKFEMSKWKKFRTLYRDQQSLETLTARAKYVPFLRLYEYSTRIMELQEGEKIWRLRGGLNKVSKLVIYGNGNGYKYTCSLIKNSDFGGSYRLIGNEKESLSKIAADEYLLVACDRSKYDTTVRLIKKKYPNVNILKDFDICYGGIGNQYFDVFNPIDNEVIIDAGAFDGKTEKQFFEWGNDHIKRIYAFELDPRNAERCITSFNDNGYNNVVFINKGVGNVNKTIHLAAGNENSASSKKGHSGVEAQICRIDDEISDRVTLIKMDIEGEELNALKGAERTIRELKPRLAICIYHKASDLYKIPGYLHKIVPEYRFVVRHYTSIEWETVLYAWV